MEKYCVTAANHNNNKDNRASEFKVWKWIQNDEKKWVWNPLGKQSLNYVAKLLAQGDQVLSAKQTSTGITSGYPIELELRIARNDENFKITDLPTF